MFSTAFLDLPALAGAHGEVSLPGSKSISNRVLLLAALSQGTTTVYDLLDSDDTRVMLEALRVLGCGIRQSGNTVQIDGLAAQLKNQQAKLFLGNAGTAMRPLTAALAVLRADPSLAAAVSTVDDIGAESGRITAVLALQSLISGAHSGQYGIGQGATAVTLAQ